jgi:hypothetical protein
MFIVLLVYTPKTPESKIMKTDVRTSTYTDSKVQNCRIVFAVANIK